MKYIRNCSEREMVTSKMFSDSEFFLNFGYSKDAFIFMLELVTRIIQTFSIKVVSGFSVIALYNRL